MRRIARANQEFTGSKFSADLRLRSQSGGPIPCPPYSVPRPIMLYSANERLVSPRQRVLVEVLQRDPGGCFQDVCASVPTRRARPSSTVVIPGKRDAHAVDFEGSLDRDHTRSMTLPNPGSIAWMHVAFHGAAVDFATLAPK